MANHPGRRAPNVSQYIANLNTISPEDDVASTHPEDFDDLALFSNAFLDYELSPTSQQSGQNLGYQAENFGIPDVSAWLPQNPSQAVPTTTSQTFNDPTNIVTSPIADFEFESHPQPGSKRTASSLTPSTPSATEPKNVEDQARIAAEEDKRRRNTAASARFRVKKKEREQALEKSAKEMTDKVKALEERIDGLENQNQFLKGLLLEKFGKEDLADQLQAFRRKSEEKEDGERSMGEPKHGVGTNKKAKKVHEV